MSCADKACCADKTRCTKEECAEGCPCDGLADAQQEFLFGMSDTVRDHLSFMYIITMSVMFQSNRTEWRDRVFGFFAEAMQSHMKMVNEIPDQPQQFYEMALNRATKYLNNILDAYRTMEGTMPPSIREMYEADRKAAQDRQIEEALAKAQEIIAEQNRKMGIDPNDPNTKTTTNVVINTNPTLKELKEQAIQYGIPLGPPGKQRVITPEEYARQQAASPASTAPATARASAPSIAKRGRPKKTAAAKSD